MKFLRHGLFAACLYILASAASAQENPFLGRWALTPESGGAGWLEVRMDEGVLAGTLLWMGGSPEPQLRVYLDGDTLNGLRLVPEDIRDEKGKLLRQQQLPISFTATLEGDTLRGVHRVPATNGAAVYHTNFTGTRIPALPPAPGLGKIEFGPPQRLFNATDLTGWTVSGGAHWGTLKTSDGGSAEGWIPSDEDVVNGWSARDGVLVNDAVQLPGQPYIRYGNLISTDAFEDFNLTLDVNLPPDGNSGIYLRGIYEIQLRDSFGKELGSHNMGALYGRITPTVAAEKPAGEWQTLDITLVQRHVTVVLNGRKIIDNQPIAGCTGGALSSDESRPGPFYFQGDHTGVQIRDIVLRPVIGAK